MCQNWFKKLHSRDFSLEDDQCVGQLCEFDNKMKDIIQLNCHVTVQEIIKLLSALHTTTENHIRCLGLIIKFDIWVSQELKEIHLTQQSILAIHI
ncbi:Histone-lysine N-methyltransferase SETMAR, partial [Stegodyphus mimosarum]